MKVFRIILRVLKILIGLHDYATQQKQKKKKNENL